jgi:hypothetical protein
LLLPSVDWYLWEIQAALSIGKRAKNAALLPLNRAAICLRARPTRCIEHYITKGMTEASAPVIPAVLLTDNMS